MWHVGIDLHREFVVVAAVRDNGEIMEPVRIACQESETILETIRSLASIGPSSKPAAPIAGSRLALSAWHDPLGPSATTRPMIQRRSKTDKLDSQLLANLLRINQIPLAYVPPEPYQRLRDLTRCRANWPKTARKRKSSCGTCWQDKTSFRPTKRPSAHADSWFRSQDFRLVGNMIRDELLARLWHYDHQIAAFDKQLEQCRPGFPQTEAISDIYGIGLYSAC